MFVANGSNQVWIVDILPDGTVYEISPFISDLNSPFALEFENNGDLFVGGTSGDIWRVDSDGGASQFGTGFAGVEGLAFDYLGNLYVSEVFEGRISKILKDYEPISIDIKPNGYPNSINLQSHGVVPVAILTTEDFDATTVDPTSVVFAGAYPLRWAYEDVDYDSDMDLIFHFRTRELNLDANSTNAILEGESFSGQRILGIDTAKIIQ